MPNNLTDAEENRLLALTFTDGDLLVLVTALGNDAVAGTEVAGGDYARQVIDWAAPAGGSRANAAAMTFEGLPTGEVKGWEVWDSTGAARRWWGLIAAKTGTAQSAASTITSTAHGLVDGLKIVFQPGYEPTGVTAGNTYYVRDATVNTFKVASVLGGGAVGFLDSSLVAFGVVSTFSGGQDVLVAAGALVCSMG